METDVLSGHTFCPISPIIGIIRLFVRLEAQRTVIDLPHAAAYNLIAYKIPAVIGAEQAPAIVKLFRGIRCCNPIENWIVIIYLITRVYRRLFHELRHKFVNP